jgi:hypothetical protein
VTVPVHVAVAVKVQVPADDQDQVYERVLVAGHRLRINRSVLGQEPSREIRIGQAISVSGVVVLDLVVDLDFDGDGDVNWDGHPLTQHFEQRLLQQTAFTAAPPSPQHSYSHSRL